MGLLRQLKTVVLIIQYIEAITAGSGRTLPLRLPYQFHLPPPPLHHHLAPPQRSREYRQPLDTTEYVSQQEEVQCKATHIIRSSPVPCPVHGRKCVLERFIPAHDGGFPIKSRYL
jgi:hypothetical protein